MAKSKKIKNISTELENIQEVNTPKPIIRVKLIVVYAILLQAITAVFVTLSPMPIRVASLGAFYDIFPNYRVGIILMALGTICALMGLTRIRNGYRFFFFLPQLVFLMLTAGSALSHVFEGRYADGVVRPWQFIFIDQLPAFITAVLYMFAVFDFVKEKDENK